MTRVEPRVVYQVREFERALEFYKLTLGFDESFVDWDEKWATLTSGQMHIAITEGEPDPNSGVAMIDVEDVKGEADRLRAGDVNVGTVIEIAGEMLLVDVYDPDGNRLQLSQPVE